MATPRASLLALYKLSTTAERHGNPYSKPQVKRAIAALGGVGLDMPPKRPRGVVAGALFDLVKWFTTGDRNGNPYGHAAVRAANRALGGDGYNLPSKSNAK